MLQYLHGYVLLRTALQASGCAKRVAGDLGRFLGETHRQTHAALLPEAQRAALEARFRNADMCAITAEYVFSKPLDEGVYRTLGPYLKRAAPKTFKKPRPGWRKKTQAGDLSTSSALMVSPSAPSRNLCRMCDLMSSAVSL